MNILNNKSIPMNIFNFDFMQNTIIEASAGTGKTFTIVILYLRLLLGLTKTKNIDNVVSIKKILIVTFTKSAKEELKSRIKKYIYDLKIACIKKNTKIFFLKQIINKIKNFKKAIYILEKAENEIDLIEIYTIHGFCKKMLNIYCFNSKLLTNNQFIENNYDLCLEATNIFWKKHCHELPYEISKLIYKEWLTAEKLLKNIYPLLQYSDIKFNKNIIKNQNIVMFHKNLIQKIIKFKYFWCSKTIYIHNYLCKINLNKHIYNEKNIIRWIKIINTWSKNKTEDYSIPITLKYFNYITIKKNIFYKKEKIPWIFKKIQHFLKINFSIKEIIIFNAIQKIPKIIKIKKSKKLSYEYNDLINWFEKFLKNKNIVNEIQKKYPIAFIDEFQDTDLKQYKIFKYIYNQPKKSILILVGDPKQAIYSFRGADIFAYFKAKSEIKKHYHLNTNFRSSKNMVNSINMLFSRIKNPFIFNQIPFKQIKTNSINKNINFIVNKLIQPSLRLIIEPNDNQEKNNHWIAKQCAINISNWINHDQKNKSIIHIQNKTRKITEEDIIVLVRNKNESQIIQLELEKINIDSIYLSNKNSIYDTPEALEILWILKSLINLKHEKLFINAFSTNIMHKNIQQIEKIQNNHTYRSYWIKKFHEYLSIWNINGIYYMLKRIISDQNILFKNQYSKKKESIIDNILHIGELLQEQETKKIEKYNLIQWFKKKIKTSNQHILKKEIIRNKNKKHAIRIINIHSSKGLEFLIVWIPFSVNYRQSKYPLYHEKNNNLILDLTNQPSSFKNSDRERLSEDIRLLYVAITRAIVHCSIGIQISKIKINKKNNITNLHKSAIGYILQLGNKLNIQQFNKIVLNLKKEKWIQITNNSEQLKKNNENNNIHYVNQNTNKNITINKTWTISSFTKLQKENKKINDNFNNNKIDVFLKKKIEFKKNVCDTHTFKKGKLSGQLLHNILKETDFSGKNIKTIILENLIKYNFNIKLLPMIESWINNIYNKILNKNNFSLSQLKFNECIKELEFLLPIKKILNSTEVNKITKKFDVLSNLSSNLKFDQKQGMISGFIDLIFYWNKKYYILDYKSNWLGANSKYYSLPKIKEEMIKQRYDLQYQIYSIALHRYLKQKIKNYKCQDYFGGVYYFFIRSADGSNQNNGIYYQKTTINLIKKLDKLI